MSEFEHNTTKLKIGKTLFSGGTMLMASTVDMAAFGLHDKMDVLITGGVLTLGGLACLKELIVNQTPPDGEDEMTNEEAPKLYLVSSQIENNNETYNEQRRAA